MNKKAASNSSSKLKGSTKPKPTSRAWSTDTIIYLTQDELRRLLKAIDNPRDYAIFLLAYRHGLRASEIGLIHVDDIDFKQGRIRLHRLKGSLGGVYPLAQDELKAIKRAVKARSALSPTLFLSRRSEAISRRQLDKLMKGYGEKAGIPEDKRHFHCLKHSIATHLLDAGAELRFVQDWIGHKQIQNTAHYAQITNPRRDAEARKVFLSGKIV